MNDRSIPYFAFEGELARQERHIKRLWILCIIIFAALILTNAGWIYYESQFEEIVTTETTQDVTQDGTLSRNIFIGGDYNGETTSQNDN